MVGAGVSAAGAGVVGGAGVLDEGVVGEVVFLQEPALLVSEWCWRLVLSSHCLEYIFLSRLIA